MRRNPFVLFIIHEKVKAEYSMTLYIHRLNIRISTIAGDEVDIASLKQSEKAVLVLFFTTTYYNLLKLIIIQSDRQKPPYSF